MEQCVEAKDTMFATRVTLVREYLLERRLVAEDYTDFREQRHPLIRTFKLECHS